MEIGRTNGGESSVDQAVELLMARVLRGAGGQLPTERELATQLGMSRPTVRAALSRLAQWGVIVARQGSGTTIQPRRRWRLGALPFLIADAVEASGMEPLGPLVLDALEFRSALVMDLLRRAAVRAQGSSFDTVRAAVLAAWEARGDAARFLELDHQFLLTVAERAGMLATVLLMNELRQTYEGAVLRLAATADVPDSYVRRHLATVDALERGDGEAAVAEFLKYLDDLNENLVAAVLKRFASTTEVG